MSPSDGLTEVWRREYLLSNPRYGPLIVPKMISVSSHTCYLYSSNVVPCWNNKQTKDNWFRYLLAFRKSAFWNSYQIH